MLAVIDHEAGGELARRVSAVYEFIYRSLVKAGHRHDEKGLDDAVRILEIERETWRQVCDRLAADAPRTTFHDAQRGVPPPGHHVRMVGSDMEWSSQPGGFSVEA